MKKYFCYRSKKMFRALRVCVYLAPLLLLLLLFLLLLLLLLLPADRRCQNSDRRNKVLNKATKCTKLDFALKATEIPFVHRTQELKEKRMLLKGKLDNV